MKARSFQLWVPVLIWILPLQTLLSQHASLKTITEEELRTHLSYLAADELEGRATGEPGLYKAAAYLADQAREMGLKSVDPGGNYFQEYTLVTKKQDFANSSIRIDRMGEQITMNRPFYFLNADTSHIELEGEIVFAGYGIYSSKDRYNSYDGLELRDKIVMIMNRGPLDETGKGLIGGGDWTSLRSWQYKLPGLVMRMPKAVLIVMDPKSGARSLEEISRGMARYFRSSRHVRELGNPYANPALTLGARIIFIHRDVAEAILAGTDHDLAGWQKELDKTLQPASFELEGVEVKISGRFNLIEKRVPNVVGMIEGMDPEMKDEIIVYCAHFDHLGVDPGGEIFNGADDNASGTTALLEIGEAFMDCSEQLKRSIMILWFSGEEIGLFGSRYYVEQPLLPLEKTIANINLDMVGAVRTSRDTGRVYREKVSVMGMDSIALIGGHQSAQLKEIHHEISTSLGLITDESKNDPDHPYRYFYRSDHYHFAKNDIPVLFYSTGIHPDYHKVTDDLRRINFTKLKKVCDLSFLVGYRLATMEERIVVDNPYSAW